MEWITAPIIRFSTAGKENSSLTANNTIRIIFKLTAKVTVRIEELKCVIRSPLTVFSGTSISLVMDIMTLVLEKPSSHKIYSSFRIRESKTQKTPALYIAIFNNSKKRNDASNTVELEKNTMETMMEPM